MVSEQETYTMLELSKRTGVPTYIIRDYVESGKIKGEKRMRGYRIDAAEADRFAEMIKEEMGEKEPPRRGRPSADSTDTMLGIPRSEIFEFLMRLIASVREDQSTPQHKTFSIKSDREILLDIMKGRYEVVPSAENLGVAPGTMVYNLARAMIVGMGAAMKEMTQRVETKIEIDDEKIDQATETVLKILL